MDTLKKELENYSLFDDAPYDYYDDELESDLKSLVKKYNLAQYVKKKKNDDPTDIASEIEELSNHLYHYMENIFETIFEKNSNKYDTPPIHIITYLKSMAKLLSSRKDIEDAFIEEFDSLDTFIAFVKQYKKLNLKRINMRVERTAKTKKEDDDGYAALMSSIRDLMTV
jgi:hypothetical protein